MIRGDKIIIYCDIDGVLANFDDAFLNFLDGRKNTIEMFRQATQENNLFSKLELMKHADELINYLRISENEGYHIELLSSLNTVNTEHKLISANDKHEWLLSHNIKWPRNFVNRKEEKERYATPNSVLIDDDILNVSNFKWGSGHGIFHVDGEWYKTIDDLKEWKQRNPVTIVHTL